MHNIAHDIQYIPIFDISIQFKLFRYCITGLMYHDMAIYRYIVASLAGIIDITLINSNLIIFLDQCYSSSSYITCF